MIRHKGLRNLSEKQRKGLPRVLSMGLGGMHTMPSIVARFWHDNEVKAYSHGMSAMSTLQGPMQICNRGMVALCLILLPLASYSL